VRGEVFCCAWCHVLKAVVEGNLARFVTGYYAEPVMPPPSNLKQLTNGAYVQLVTMLLCDACMPAGAEATRLAEVGIRLE
jgi:hypothetical protein